MRSTVDGYVYYKFIEKFKFKNFLEIGFYEGQTAGLLLELSSADSQIDCVDPTPKTKLFVQIYNEFNDKFSLHTMKSVDFIFNKQYDFIIIDGSKEIENVTADINNAIASLSSTGVLIVNEYYLESVQEALTNTLFISDLLPILQTNQSFFFSHPRNNRSEFLDFELTKDANNFIRFYNIDINGHMVLRVDSLPIFTDCVEFFDLALRTYNI